jgi:hypothetical protein
VAIASRATCSASAIRNTKACTPPASGTSTTQWSHRGRRFAWYVGGRRRPMGNLHMRGSGSPVARHSPRRPWSMGWASSHPAEPHASGPALVCIGLSRLTRCDHAPAPPPASETWPVPAAASLSCARRQPSDKTSSATSCTGGCTAGGPRLQVRDVDKSRGSLAACGQWQVPLPVSVNVASAVGMNCHA